MDKRGKFICVVMLSMLFLMPLVSSSDEFGYNNILRDPIRAFLDLLDVPSSYSGESGNCVAVNGAETGLEFIACGGGGGSNSWWPVTFSWLVNNSNSLDFNETKLNNSISLIANLSLRNIFDQGLNQSSNVTHAQLNLTESLLVNGSVEIDHTAEHSDDHAIDLEIDARGFGGVSAFFIDFMVGILTAENDEASILININQFLATGGDISGIEILTTEGGARVIGLEVGVQIDPVVQESGIFANMDFALNNGTDNRSDFISTAINTSIFTFKGETITLGNAIRFEEIEVILSTTAGGGGILSAFYHSTGNGTWDEFSPIDGTNNMKDTGSILWLDEDILNWATGESGDFLIRINRTRAILPKTPVVQFIQIASATEYFWNKDGDIKIQNINVTNNITFPTINTGTCWNLDCSASTYWDGSTLITKVT